MVNPKLEESLLAEISFVESKLKEIRERNIGQRMEIKDQADYERYCSSLNYLVKSIQIVHQNGAFTGGVEHAI
jgi:hypothetical protein